MVYKPRPRTFLIPWSGAVAHSLGRLVWTTAPGVDREPSFGKRATADLALLHPVDVKRLLRRAVERLDSLAVHFATSRSAQRKLVLSHLAETRWGLWDRPALALRL